MVHEERIQDDLESAPSPFDEKYLLDRWFDAIKLVGAGNTAAFFAAAIAIYYFGRQPPPVPCLLLIVNLLYFAGSMVFVWAITQLNRYLMTFDPILSKDMSPKRPAGTYKLRARKYAYISAAIWFVASLLAAFVIYRLLTSPAPIAPMG